MKKGSIRKELIGYYLGLSVLPLLLLSALLSWHHFSAQKQQIMHLQQELTRVVSQSISDYLSTIEHRLTTHINEYHRTNISPEETEKQLSKLIYTSKDKKQSYTFRQLTITNAEGIEQARTSLVELVTHTKLTDISHQAEFINPKNTGRIFHGDIHFDKLSQDPLINISVPINDLRSGKFKGVLIAQLRLRTLWSMLQELQLGETGLAYIADKQRKLIAHPSPSEVLRHSFSEIPSQTGIVKHENQYIIAATHSIDFGDEQLLLITEYPMHEAFNQLPQNIAIIFVLTSLTLISALVLGITIVRRTIVPIEAMADTANKISHGEIEARVDYKGDDELGALANSFNDMTKQLHNSIKHLQQEKLLIQNAIESLPHPFYIYDAHSFQVMLSNSAADFNQIGKPASCFCCADPYSEQAHKLPPCTAITVLETEKPSIIEHTVKHKDGQRSVYTIHGFPVFDRHGSLIQIIEYILNISEQTLLEEQLRQSQKLEALGSLAGGIAHDFNNLLGTIIGFADLILCDLEPDHPLRGDIENIYKAGERGTDLTQQLLTFSRKRQLSTTHLNINQVIEEMNKILERAAGKNIHIETHLENSIWHIQGDRSQMDQILLNLAINARDAMPDGGKFIIETSNVTLGEDYEKLHKTAMAGPYVMISLSDTGSGIPNEIKNKIFDPFFTTKGQAGTGLGLSTVFGIISQHGGFIDLQSDPAVGTCFKIYLPASDLDSDETQHPDEDKIAENYSGSGGILIVDDDETTLELTSRFIKRLGYHVYKASNAKQAFTQMEQHQDDIRLLLTDLVMTGIDGQQLALLAAEHYPHIRHIYMSGYSYDIISEKLLSTQHAVLISKPIRFSELAKQLHIALNNS